MGCKSVAQKSNDDTVLLSTQKSGSSDKTKGALIITAVVVGVLALVAAVIAGMGTLTYFYPSVMIWVDLAVGIPAVLLAMSVGFIFAMLHGGVAG